MNNKEFNKYILKAGKPLKCICGKTYNNDFKGGFVTNGTTYIWCCSQECADQTQNKLY